MGRRPSLTLERLAQMPPGELEAEWARRHGAPAPRLSPELLRLGIGYRLQEQKLGGISRATRSLLRQAVVQAGEGAARPALSRKLTPGTRLVRDWHGVGHTVTVLDDGFRYDGQHWKSLSAIARAITGTNWNGPLFFGLAGRKR
ncbi:MAG: DUF2924 domain-containing protein [Pseudomonadota bacterium]